MQDAYKQAQNFESRLKSYLDQPNSSDGVWLRQEIIRLMDDIETGKNARSLESRVQVMKQRIQNWNDDNVMDHSDQDDLIDRCDQLIQLFRRMS